MTPIYDKPFESNLAWTGKDLTVEKIAFNLTQGHVDALEELLRRFANTPVEAIQPADCRHPALDEDFGRILDEVQDGRGIVLVRGFPVEGHSIEDIEKLNWIAGLHWGDMVCQNALGEKIRRIQNEPRPTGQQSASGTKSRDDLAMHTDNAEIFTLLCVRAAKSGGETQFTNAFAIHNELLRSRPDLLEILYRGFPWHRRGEQGDDQPEITPFNVPVFSNKNGYVSVQLAYGSVHAAMLTTGRQLTAAEREALDVLRELQERLQFEMRFEPGDLCVANNLTMFHARSEYVDVEDPAKKRVLLRLWMAAARNRRPVVPEVWYMQSPKGPGVDHVPGRKVAANEYYGVSEDINQVIKEAQKRNKPNGS